jgi:hypothetical protein
VHRQHGKSSILRTVSAVVIVSLRERPDIRNDNRAPRAAAAAAIAPRQRRRG